MKSEILILGSTGSIGYAFAENLMAKNTPITLLVRNVQKARKLFGNNANVEIIQGDAQDNKRLNEIAKDKKYIFHGINYPYHQWFGNMDTVTDKIIEAASLNNATIIFPANVYNYGNTPIITEESPENPCSRKGGLRVEIEKKLRNATQTGKCKVLKVCLPDFWGPNVMNEGVRPIFENALHGKSLPYLVRVDIPHQLVFTKDAAEIIVKLMQYGQTKSYQKYNYGGQVHENMRTFLNQISRIANAPEKVTVYPKWLFNILGIFNLIMGEVKEMLYLFENAVILDDSKVRKMFPAFKETPLDEAISETISWFQNRE